MTPVVRVLVIGAVLWSGAATASPGLRRVGVMTDVGVPDGGTAALVFRPTPQVRLSAGASHNGVGPGWRGGLTLVPLSWWCSPTLSLTVGRYGERDANPAVRAVSGDASFSSPVLERVGYDYTDAHLGFELGRKRFTFYVHGGMTRLTTHVRNLSAVAADGAGGDTPMSVTFTRDPDVTVMTLSARVGFVLYIL